MRTTLGFLLIGILLFSGKVCAQSEAEAAPVPALELKSKLNSQRKPHYLRNDKRVTLWLDNEGGKAKGRIDSLSETGVWIGGNEYAFDSILAIRGRSTAMLITNIAGAIITTFGGFITTGGVLVLVAAISAADPWAALIFLILSLLILGIGTLLLIVGIPLLFLRGRKYKAINWTMAKGRYFSKKARKNLKNSPALP